MDQIENLEDLQETLFRKGFPKEIAERVAQKAMAGQVEIAEEYLTKLRDDEVGYLLHFKADQEKSKAYLNSFDVAIFNTPDGIREQNISSHSLITSGEAYRMLKYGTKVAVNKDLFNKDRVKYNVWLSFDISGPKDEYGNYPVNSYHEKYYKKKPFDVGQSLQNLHVPVLELEDPKKAADYEAALKKANIIPVTIMHDKEQQAGYLCINPKVGDVDVYDKNMDLIERPSQEIKTSPQQRQSEAPTGEKKKPWGNKEAMNWAPRKGQHKGMSK